MAYRLLIVPGDNEALRALQGQLGSDVEVQVLNSANDALWEVRNSPPEAIIADVDLPGMSGLDLAEILPNFGVSTKVVLWSREPDSQAAQQAASHGVHHFLNGPLAPADLRNLLYDVLSQAASSAQTAVIDPPAPVAPAPTPVAPAPAPTPVAPTPAPTPVAPAPAPTPARATPAEPVPERRASRPAPTPAPEPPAPIRRPTSRRREGALVLTNDNLPPIRNRLTELQQEVGSQCIVLADRAGMPLTEIGAVGGLPTMILLPLLSTTFSTAGQISQVLREGDSSALYMQEGTHYDLYCFDVSQRFMLVLIFDKAASATKIGTAWVYAKRAIRDMQEMLV